MYMPEINEKKCDQCDECIDVCPTGVLEKNENRTVVANPQDCLGCESCVSVCPREAITVKDI
ncbi:MAG: 4Fe-4S dicluster domain-containing protein [Thermodesulfobacteriota bacterium]